MPTADDNSLGARVGHPEDGADKRRLDHEYKRGLQLARDGEFFLAHEAFELAWRGASAQERDFFQGLVHAVVFCYQHARGRAVGAERQRVKAIGRLGGYAPAHRGLDVERLLAALVRAEPDLREQLVEADPKPPVLVEEEQQAERDEDRP
jgi:hypothetical protein